MGYVGGPKESGCIFCDKAAAHDDRANLILHRGADTFVIMNLYPYNTGHLMIVPYAHVASVGAIPAAALQELAALLPWLTAILGRALRPTGFNVGMNVGEVAGAGIAEHLHLHIVPRWSGDANFMPILANTKVLPELIPVTQARILAEMARTPFPATEDISDVAEQAGGVVIDAEGRVALRRAKAGDWVLPKGHIEAGESVATAAVREVAEEMGLATRILDWLGDYHFAYKKARHVGYFLLRVDHRLSEFAEHEEVDTFFLPPGEAVARLSFENDRALVQLAVERDTAIRAQESRPDA
jgi:ATP adenylyltransferase